MHRTGVHSGVGSPQYERRGTDYSEQQPIGFFKFMKLLESLVYLLILFYFGGVITGIIFPPVEDLAAENPTARLLWFPIYGLVLMLAAMNITHLTRLAIFNPLLIICLLWCGISMIWSIDPQLTMRRSVAVLMTTLAGLTIAARYDWDGLVQRLAFVFFMMAVATLVIVLINPGQGIMQDIHVGAWRGPFPEKNYLGGKMAQGVAVCMCAYAMRPKLFWLWIPAGLLCFFLVLMSTSKTALLVSVFSIGVFLALRLFRRFPILRLPVLYLFVAGTTTLITLYLTIPDELFAIIGKDATFTGRTDIWSELILAVKAKPIMGYGYGTFWEDPLGPSYAVRQALQWGVPTAHNGWFETSLSTGIVGVVLFAVLYIIAVFLAFDRIKRGGVESYWAVLGVLIFGMFSFSESTILQQNDLSWLIFVATASKLFAFERAFWRDGPVLNYALGRRDDLRHRQAARERRIF